MFNQKYGSRLHKIAQSVLPMRFCQPQISFVRSPEGVVTTTVVASWFGSLFEFVVFEEEKAYLSPDQGISENSFARKIAQLGQELDQHFGRYNPTHFALISSKVTEFFGKPRPTELIKFLLRHASPGVTLEELRWDPRSGVLTVKVESAHDGAVIFDLRNPQVFMAFSDLMSNIREPLVITFSNPVGKAIYPFATPPDFHPLDEGEKALLHKLQQMAVVL